MADFTGHFRGVPKSVPMQSLRSPIIELWNLLLIRSLSGRRRFFGNAPPKFASATKNSQDLQVLTQRILTVLR